MTIPQGVASAPQVSAAGIAVGTPKGGSMRSIPCAT